MNKQQFQLTKIVATLGPATSSFDKIRQLVVEGVRNFRINFSHGEFEDYKLLVDNIRKAEEDTDTYLSIIGDLSGPKIRIANLTSTGTELRQGLKIAFVKSIEEDFYSKDELQLTTTLPSFIDEVVAGEKILLDDGNVELKCIKSNSENNEKGLLCEVVAGNRLSKGKGINLPQTELSVEALTEKDKLCVKFAIENQFDYLALSFVRNASDLQKLKEMLVREGEQTGIFYSSGDLKDMEEGNFMRRHAIPVITKIEKPQAIENLEEIVQESDVIMVARGDLGVEMNLSEVAILQKKIIQLCQTYGRPVIVATQMLQSMIDNPVPTRAEVSDVANAILDGADAVMLSGETAVGKYPVETVKRMNEIACQTNRYIKSTNTHPAHGLEKPFLSYRAAAIAKGVETISQNIETKMLVLWTNLGGSAVYLSQRKLPVPILVFNDDISRLRQLALLYGIKPVKMQQPKSGSQFIKTIDKLLLRQNWAVVGDGILILSGDPINRKGFANRIVVHYLGESVD